MRILLAAALAMLSATATASAQDRTHFEGEGPIRKADFRNAPRRVKIMDERPIVSDFRETDYAGTVIPQLPPAPQNLFALPPGPVSNATTTTTTGVSGTVPPHRQRTGGGNRRAGASAVQSSEEKSASIKQPNSMILSVNDSGPDSEKCTPGLVHWHQSVADATSAAAQSGKPVLILQLMGKLDEKFC